MPHIFVEPPESWSFALPPRLRLAIGDAIALFSRIDHAIVEIHWINESADLQRKRIISKRSASDNIKELKKIVEGLPVDTAAIWGAFDRLRNDRNIIGHSVWMVDNSYVPWAVWHSQFLESDDYVVGEQFAYERFSEIMKVANHLHETLLQLMALLSEATQKREIAEAAADNEPNPLSPGVSQA